MNSIVDTIVLILFILMLAFFVIGFNKQTLESYQRKIQERDKRHEDALKAQENNITEENK